MTFAIILNDQVDQYPVYQGEIENNLEYSLPNDWQGGVINGVQYAKVIDNGTPEFGEFERVSIGSPINIEGRWYVNYIVEPWTEEEIQNFHDEKDKMVQAKIALQQLGLRSVDIDRYLASIKPLPQPQASGLQDL